VEQAEQQVVSKVVAEGEAMSDTHWTFYRDSRGEWRWRRQTANGEIVGAASEGYHNWSECMENARLNGMQEDSAWTSLSMREAAAEEEP
jgi:uncharacterized protein YegP (UPF0339 family)